MHDRPFVLSRREVLAGTAAAFATVAAPSVHAAGKAAAAAQSAPSSGPFVLPALPYELDALAPSISSRTLSIHHGKHHQAYVDKANGLVKGTSLASESPEEIVRQSARKPESASLFSNAAQAWNHSFYWKSMKPGGGGEPGGELARLAKRDFGHADGLRRQLVEAGAAQFGSGWAWLVLDGGKLRVTKTSNADTPLTTDAVPLLTVDVWEHAYYLDHQNRRSEYLSAWIEKLVAWDFAEANLQAQLARTGSQK